VTSSGEVDANYFQHINYLNNYNEENGTDLVGVAGHPLRAVWHLRRQVIRPRQHCGRRADCSSQRPHQRGPRTPSPPAGEPHHAQGPRQPQGHAGGHRREPPQPEVC
jgi:hypothetical protein